MAEKAGVIQSLVRGSDWIFASPWRNFNRKRTSGGYSGHHHGYCTKWRPERENSRGRRWNALHWRHCRYATFCELERHGQPTAVGWDNWSSKGKRVAQESRMWDRGPRDGYASSKRRGAGEGAMLQWHTTFPPRANWKPSGSSRSLGPTTDLLRWHGHRRGGATEAWAAGARGPLLQLMGRWCTPSMAVSCATPTHAWEFESRRRQPVPMCEGGELKVVFGEWSALQWWGTCVQREIRELGRGAAEDGATLGSVDVARKRRRANSTGAGAFRFDPEAVEDSAVEGEGIAGVGDQ